jgi:hypothetical protein
MPRSALVNHKKTATAERHRAMLELTVMGIPSPILVPAKWTGRSPAHGATPPPRHHWGFFPRFGLPNPGTAQERVRFISRDVAEVRPDRRTVWSLDARRRDGESRLHPSFAKWLLPIPIRALPHTLRGDCPKVPAGLRKATSSLQDTAPEHRRVDG